MTNPFLSDTIQRAGRDPVRKLSPNDRIFGTMQLALEQNITPKNMAFAAAAAIVVLLKNPDQNNVPEKSRTDSPYHPKPEQIENVLNWLWQDQKSPYTDVGI